VYSTDDVKGVSKKAKTTERYSIAIMKEFLDLEGACIRVLPRSEIGKDWCFVLVGGTGQLVLQAEDEHDMLDWCSMLHYAKSMANTGDFVIDALAHAAENEDEATAKAAEAQERAIAMMAGSGTQSLFEGYMNKFALGIKHKRRIRSWRKRYFVLQEEGEFFRLAYYENADRALLKGTVDLNPQMVVDVSELKENALRIADHTTEMVCQAPDEATRTQWMAAIRQCVDKLKGQAATGKTAKPLRGKATKRGSCFTFARDDGGGGNPMLSGALASGGVGGGAAAT
jgi:hypothetical protein